MQPRLNAAQLDPDAYRAMQGLEQYLATRFERERSLLKLVKLRASQMNGCAYCIDMHTKDARANGETEQRLYALTAWREAPFYSERAALAWTEALTFVSERHAPDEIYQQTRTQFTEPEIVALTMAIVAINAWNRLAIGFRAVPGDYQPKVKVAQQE